MGTYRRFAFKDGVYINKNAGREFNEGIKDLFPDVSAVCHNFSFSQIEKTIFYTLSNFSDNPEAAAANLHNLSLAVAHLDQNSEAYLNSIELIKIIAVNLEPQSPEQAESLCDCLNKLLYILNSAPENLRYGNSRWNSSIGEEFDPQFWCYVNNEGNLLSSDTGIQNSEDIQLPDNPIEEGFYLYDEEEGSVLDYIIEQVKPESQISIYTALNELYDKPFIYSSSNLGGEFYPSTHSKIKPSDKPIYHWGVTKRDSQGTELEWGWKKL